MPASSNVSLRYKDADAVSAVEDAQLSWQRLDHVELAEDASEIDFEDTVTGVFDGTYDEYEIVFNLLWVEDTSTPHIYCRMSEGGVYKSGSSDYSYTLVRTFTSTLHDAVSSSHDAAQIQLAHFVSQGYATGVLHVMSADDDSRRTAIQSALRSQPTVATRNLDMKGSGIRTAKTAIDGIRLFLSAGDLFAGSWATLYGRKKTA